MEVTRTNFQEVLTELDDVLNKASFLAIDGEFTGLNSGPDASAFDTPAQYYVKLKNGSMDFLLVQFGLSVFTYHPGDDKYDTRSYNFYVFPTPLNRSAPDCRFLCQASSMSFLANQGFDFNKLFKDGIPYLTQSERENLVKKMEEKQKMREEGLDYIQISDGDKPQIEDICSNIKAFLESEEVELKLDKCNAFVRRLVYQEAKVRWPTKIRVETKNDNGFQSLCIYKTGTQEEEEKLEAEKRQKEKLEVQEAVGLSALLQKIANSGKLIVGHNMLLDLCHVINQFFGQLPDTYAEFKLIVHDLFPKLMDTKIISLSSEFKEKVPNILGQLFDTLRTTEPFKLPKLENIEGRDYEFSTEMLHEAGYDALITGICFLTMANHLGQIQEPKISTVLADSPLLNPFVNKLLIARLKDYPYINIVGKDPNPNRDHVFHITFPREWKYPEVNNLFSPYGGGHINWLTDTTAFVGLYKRDQAKTVFRQLSKSKELSIKRYSEHQNFVECAKKNPMNKERKRKINERSVRLQPAM